MFWGAGEYDIPVLTPVKKIDVEKWVTFNYAKGCKDADKTGVTFFIDDYQFERVWQKPDVYVKMLADFGAVCMSDFASENEVLHSRKQMTKGYDIVDYTWRSDGGAVFVTIADRKRK